MKEVSLPYIPKYALSYKVFADSTINHDPGYNLLAISYK